MEFCYTCGNKGLKDKVCPECGHEPRNNSLDFKKKIKGVDLLENIKDIQIPLNYAGVLWNKESLIKDHLDKVEENGKDLVFESYYRNLDKINSIFVDNKIPHKSAFIAAPAGYSKVTFAYSCMQRALNAGFNVAPLLDSCEVKRAMILSAENPKYKINKVLDFDDYIMSDVLFMTITKLHTYTESYQIIQELMDKRSRRGLSTFIISRYSFDTLAKFDKTNNFNALAKDSSDVYKYPAIVQYFPNFMGTRK